jgi:hypothetical protein
MLDDRDDSTKNFKKSFHCPSCGFQNIQHSKQRHCLTCKDNKNKPLRLFMDYYFDIKYQIKNIIQKNVIDFHKTSESDDLHDLKDGSLYQDFLKEIDTSSGNVFTLSINTDGVNPSNKSKISLWPVFLVVNEIPLEERYCIENVIIAGYIYLLNVM